MKALAIVWVALIAGVGPAAPGPAASPGHLCLPEPQRTTPRGLYERVDKWQHDQRTIA